MKRTRFMIVLGLLFVSSFALFAQPTAASDCQGALAKDYYRYASSSSLNLDWLQSIDRETYESAQKNNNFSFLGMFTGGAFNMSDDFSQFDQKRSKYLSTNHYTRSESEAKQIVSLTTSDRAYEAYEACLRTIGGGGGVLVWASKVTINRIDLVVRWAGQPGRKSARLYGMVIGGHVIGQANGKIWKSLRLTPLQERPFTIIPNLGESETTIRVQDEFGDPVTSVTFERADGIITLLYKGSSELLRVPHYTAVGPLSPDNNNNKGGCPRNVGRDQGGFCKSSTQMSFSVAAPLFLKNAVGGAIGGGAPWSQPYSGPTISADGLTVAYSQANWGSPINPTVTVDIYEHITPDTCGVPTIIPVIFGQQVVLSSTQDCGSLANVQWKTLASGNSGVVVFGESTSVDQKEGISASVPVKTGGVISIGYRLRLSPPVDTLNHPEMRRTRLIIQ